MEKHYDKYDNRLELGKYPRLFPQLQRTNPKHQLYCAIT